MLQHSDGTCKDIGFGGKLMILLIDNYDSFTYNLYQYIGTFTDAITVVRNDKITIAEIEKIKLIKSYE